MDSGIFGSIYFDDIEMMLLRENKGRFCLLGRENTVMADSENWFRGKSFEMCMIGEICLGVTKEQVNSNLRQKKIGGYWSFGQGGAVGIVQNSHIVSSVFYGLDKMISLTSGHLGLSPFNIKLVLFLIATPHIYNLWFAIFTKGEPLRFRPPLVGGFYNLKKKGASR